MPKKLWPIIRFQLDQFLHESSIFVCLIDYIRPPCNRGVDVFSIVVPYYFPCFQKGHFPLVFHLKYFFFFFGSCISRMALSTVRTTNFLQAIFLLLVWVLFTVFGTCRQSSTDFIVVSIFLTFEATQGCWDVLLNPLKTITDLHFLGSMGLVKCHNVSVGLDSFFAFSGGDFYVCNSVFPGLLQSSLL